MAGVIKTLSSFKWYGEEQKKKINSQVERGMKKCGFAIERDAKRMCAVDTGRLRASISTAWTGQSGGRASISNPVPDTQPDDPVSVPTDKDFTVQIGTNVEYASFLEFGTFGMGGAQPFLFPAYEANIRKLPEYIKGEKVERMALE